MTDEQRRDDTADPDPAPVKESDAERASQASDRPRDSDHDDSNNPSESVLRDG